VSVPCRLPVFVLAVLPAIAQSQAFETITIRPHVSGAPANAHMQVLPDGDLTTSAVPVIMLLAYAYDVPTNPSPRLSGLPDWAIHERYDVEAKAPPTPFAQVFPKPHCGSRVGR
jgi:uncharacterized protein (TIGR03435 family)